jgi:hypothetical protein
MLVPLNLPLFVVSVIVFTFLQAMEVRVMNFRVGKFAQKAVLTFWLNACHCFIAADHLHQTH